MKEPYAGNDTERVGALLRETAARIAPARDRDVVVDGVLAGATDFFFGVDSPIGTVYVAAGAPGGPDLAPAASEGGSARPYRGRL